MKEERLILVTNDDGYDSKGLAAAVEVARGFGRVVVVAPETTQSGMSQAITMYNPLYLRCVRKEEGLEVYAFSGTPVDCVKMAFDYLLREERVDLVISGINHGSNSAVNVLYSGTMGAAIEGSFYGCPAVGLSLDDHGEDADFEAAVAYGRRIVGSVLENRIELPLCLNVNVPVGRPTSCAASVFAARIAASGARSSTATRIPAAGSISGLREPSSTKSRRRRTPTNGPCRTVTSRWCPCRWT